MSPPMLLGLQIPFRGLFDLKQFTAVRSLWLQIWPSPKNYSKPEPLTKYKALIGARLDIFVAIFAMNVHDSQQFDTAAVNANNSDNYDEELIEMASLMILRSCLDSAWGFHKWAQSPVVRLPALRELVITSKMVGKVCLGKDQIVELRNHINSGVESELSFSKVIGGNGDGEGGGVAGVKIWHAPRVLELPSSGRVLEWATVAVVRPDGEEIAVERDLDLILSAFGGGEEDEDDDLREFHEVVNVAREKMASDKDPGASIKTHRLDLDLDEE